MNDPLENINSKEDFVRFAKELSEDFDNNREEWENGTISHYLESMAACVESMNTAEIPKNFGVEMPRSSDWKFLALVLWTGKFYE